MTIEEYQIELKVTTRRHNNEITSIKEKFASENNPYKVGDKIKDHIGSGIIEAIGFYYSNPPYCTYAVTVITAKGEPTKAKEKRRIIYQCNIN